VTILHLLRHGETDWNRDLRIQGSTDIPLNDTGRRQAREAGERLRAELGDAAVVVVSSDMSRAAETADIIASILGTAVRARHAGLRERHYGEAEGLRADEFRARFGEWHQADVPGAEAWPDARRRALDAIDDIVATAAEEPGAPEVVAVAHGALIRQVIRHATDEEFPLEGHRLANASVHTFRVDDGRLGLLASSAVPA
jgi:broad specificity phosphatase PhoE